VIHPKNQTWAADGRSVTIHWDEIPKFVIRTRAASRRLAWVSNIDGNAISVSIYPQMAMTFLDGDEAVRTARDLRERNRFLPCRVVVRPGRKKV
jgi:hypothetical protein